MTERGAGDSLRTADWLVIEHGELHLEGIARAPEETRRGLDRLWAALRDEGDGFDGLDEDEVEAAISLLAESGG